MCARRRVCSGAGVAVVGVFLALLAGCHLPVSAGGGPMTWIDQPLAGDVALLEPLTIQVHASDGDGVAVFEFFVNSSPLGTLDAAGGRLEEAHLVWQPPQAGDYLIGVRAVDGAGNSGDMASVRVRVGAPQPIAETPLPQPTPSAEEAQQTPTESAEPSPTSQEAATPTPSTPQLTLLQNANCRSGPDTAYDIVDGVKKDSTVVIEGRNAERTWWWVVRPSGTGHCWVIASAGKTSGDVQGVKIVSAPALPATSTSTPAPPADITPPVISNAAADPQVISASVACGATPAQVVVSAQVSDNVAVHSVIARVAGVGEYAMSASGDVYQRSLGPFDAAGTLTIFVQAQDTSGNAATSAPLTVQVVSCPG
ncbi:MAG: hypothetical protein HPY45_13745 [Anaerolineae bacterium]|nr:hypothetical protein [Anaerolineae bacterium]